MPSWLNTLFKGNAAPRIAAGAFGKHPGWNDHIEDIGLETEGLLAARQLLYVQGIGGLIDSAAWDKMGPGEALPEFGHVVVWFGEGEILAARLWSSRDGKGRTKYPMVVCAHAAGVEPGRALRVMLPELLQAEEACRATTASADVIAFLDRSRQRLREALGAEAPASPPPLPGADGSPRGPQFSSDSEAWLRTFYAAESQLAPFGPGKVSDAQRRISLKMCELPVVAQQLRLPAAPEARLAEFVLFWQRLLVERLKVKAPLLFLQPFAHPWLDLIVGCPTPKQLICLRASEKVIPLQESIPYTLPEGFRGRAAEALQLTQG